nr:unnamed protein product [Callosobruchus chinensis]
MQVEVFTTKNKKLGSITVSENTKVKEIKKEIAKICKLSVDRQSVRDDLKGKDIKDDASVSNLSSTKKVYVKDLGPQIGWNTVFLLEYAGPLVVYALVSTRPWILYGEKAAETSLGSTARIALMCWSTHYAKRILETLFVHRFSHGTMPIRNLFKNCGYYWGFCLYVAYHVNHPLFTPPPYWMQVLGLAIIDFQVCEVGNLSIHLLLRDLRPPGSTVRKIPMPNSNPLTQLFHYVSCPNYTYEVGAWVGFSLMTSCLPGKELKLTSSFKSAISGVDRNFVRGVQTETAY